MGANIHTDLEKNYVIVNGDLQNHPLKGIEIDCIEIPDLFPLLTVIGAFADGKTILQNISRFKLKETDRVSAMITELSKMGVNIVEEDNKITIFKCDNLKGVKIYHHNDHRVAMACTIACLYAETSSYIEDSQIVNDSYPSFFKNLRDLGVEIEELQD
jgi:3-phosphoshikimate 1-carboxyvinyltransferase